MPRKGLRVIAEVTIQCVTCPGVRLPLEHDVFLSICLLGQHVHTRCTAPIFPLMFREKFKFVKTFPCCSDFQQLDCALREEVVVLELVRDDKICNQMVVLGIYETCAQNFLFPLPGVKPCYSSTDNEAIMDPTNDFPGCIGPKVEFSSMTTIKETCRPELDCLKDKVCKIDICCRKYYPCLPSCSPCPRPCPAPCPLPCSDPCCSPCPSPCSPCPPRCKRRCVKSCAESQLCSGCCSLPRACSEVCPCPRPSCCPCPRPNCCPPRCPSPRCPSPCSPRCPSPCVPKCPKRCPSPCVPRCSPCPRPCSPRPRCCSTPPICCPASDSSCDDSDDDCCPPRRTFTSRSDRCCKTSCRCGSCGCRSPSPCRKRSVSNLSAR